MYDTSMQMKRQQSIISSGWLMVSMSLVVSFIVVPVENYRILAVETIAGKSHWNFMGAVLRSLTDAGHEVTAFTPLPDGDRENYTEVDTSGEILMWLDLDVLHIKEMFGTAISMLGMTGTLSRSCCNSVFGNSLLGELITGNRTGNRTVTGFDAIVMEPLVTDCMSYLADALNAPIIYVIPSPMPSQVERAFTGHFSNPASVSHFFSHHAVPGTFAQRLANTALLAYSVLVTSYDQRMMKIADSRPYDSSPTVCPSVIFQNSHYITDAPKPVTANHVNIGIKNIIHIIYLNNANNC